MHVVQEEKLFHLHLKAFLLGVALSTLSLTIAGFFWLHTTYKDRFFEGVSIDQIDVSKMTKAQAIEKVSLQNHVYTQVITLRTDTQSIASSAAELGLHRN